MKVFRHLVLLSLLLPQAIVAQTSDVLTTSRTNSEYGTIDELLEEYKFEEALIRINSRLQNKDIPLNVEIGLRKLEALIGIEQFSAGLQLIEEIEGLKLTRRQQIELLLFKAQAFEWINMPEETRLSLELLESLYGEEIPFNDENYGDYLVRRTSYERLFGDRDLVLTYADSAAEYGRKYNIKHIDLQGVWLQAYIDQSLNFDERLKKLQYADSLYHTMKNWVGAASMASSISFQYYNTGDLNKAFDYNLQGIQSARKGRDSITLAVLHAQRSRYFESKGQVDSALIHLKKSYLYESANQLKMQRVQLAEMEYASLKERNTQERLNNEEQQRQREDNTMVLLGLSIFLFGMLALTLFFYRRTVHQAIELKDAIKLSQQQTEEKEALLKEVHHRVKNNLQMLSSLIYLQSHTNNNKKVQQVLTTGQNQIQAIALVHEMLYNKQSLSKISLRKYIVALKEHLTSNYPSSDVDIFIDVDDVSIDAERVILFGLVVNELFTNSLRHMDLQQKPLRVILTLRTLFSDHDEYTAMTVYYRDNNDGFTGNLTKIERKDSVLSILLQELKAKYTVKNGNEYTINLKTI